MDKKDDVTVIKGETQINNRIEEYRSIYGDWPECLGVLDELRALCKSPADEIFIYAYMALAFCYSKWLIREAQKNDVKRLYFVARDGWRWKNIASAICEKTGLNVECRYLRLSRYALNEALSDEDVRERFKTYLLQEGLADGVPYALADSGWIGTLQRSFMKCAGGQIRDAFFGGFYFGLYEIPSKAEKSGYNTFYFAQYKDENRKKCFNNNLFELFSAESVGQTVGYERQADGKVYPVISEAGNPNSSIAADWDNLTSRFAEKMIEIGAMDEVEQNLLLSAKAFNMLCSEPVPCEVENFGDMLFCHNEGKSELRPLAEYMTLSELKGYHVISKFMEKSGIGKENRVSAWPEGSAVRVYMTGELSKDGLIKELRAIRRYKFVSAYIKRFRKSHT